MRFPRKSKGRASVQPLTVTRNRWLGTAGMYLLALVNFSKCRCHAEFFDLKNPKDPQPHYIILPNFEQLFFKTSRNIRHHYSHISTISIQPSSPSRDRLFETPPSPLHSPAFSRAPSLSRSLSHRKIYNFPRPYQEFRAPPLSAPRYASSPFATPHPATLLDFRLTLENLSPSEASLHLPASRASRSKSIARTRLNGESMDSSNQV